MQANPQRSVQASKEAGSCLELIHQQSKNQGYIFGILHHAYIYICQTLGICVKFLNLDRLYVNSAVTYKYCQQTKTFVSFLCVYLEHHEDQCQENA